MKREIVVAAMLFLAPSCANLPPAPPLTPSAALVEPQQPPGERTEIFVSDLHLGPGRLPDHRWDPYEDFRWGDAFAKFLTAIDDGKTDLVLAGDSFELWQYHAPDCADRPDVGCSEEVSMAHLAVSLRAHADELLALGRFAAKGENRVVFLPGNHDAGLLFPRAAALVYPFLRHRDSAGAGGGPQAADTAGARVVRHRRRLFFPLAWYGATVVFFSFVHLKKDAYLLPVMPAQALLVARFVHASLAWARRRPALKWLDTLTWIQTAVGAVAAVALVVLIAAQARSSPAASRLPFAAVVVVGIAVLAASIAQRAMLSRSPMAASRAPCTFRQ